MSESAAPSPVTLTPALLRQRSADLFLALHDPDGSEADRRDARAALIGLHLPLVEHCARRFRTGSEPHEDVVQVGTIGLIKAVDRFDHRRGTAFSTYATPTILGEIRRHFRDHAWTVRVPRRVQEVRLRIGVASAELTQTLGRSPSARELAGRLGIPLADVLDGLASTHATAPLPLDTVGEPPDGGADDRLRRVEIRASVRPLIDALDPRAQRILVLRFVGNLTQEQIAAEVGISQMHVSRLLRQTLAQLRRSLAEA